MILAVILLAGCSLALPTPEAEETDGDVSRKILGSSVVTSVSVIMDVGNGSQTYFSDAVGKPMTKPSAATQLASPINLLNPDRYEFYTFDDSGDLVKRLMTLDEIQGIIASGDGEALNYNSQSLTGDEPEKRVDDVVNNVQNVLKEEMEAHKTSAAKPMFDTPDVTSTWNMILPAIFGNSGENIVPEKQPNSATAETIMIEPTTLLPLINDSYLRTETTEDAKQTTNMFTMIPDVTTEVPLKEASNENSQTESSSEIMDTPIITVEINSNDAMMHDEVPADSKTDSLYVTETEATTNKFKDSSSAVYDNTLSLSEIDSFTSRPFIIISSPSPFTNKIETLYPSTTSPLSSAFNSSSASPYTTRKPSPALTTTSPAPTTASPALTTPSPRPTTPSPAPTTTSPTSTTTSPSTTLTTASPSTALPSTTSRLPPTFAKPLNEVTTPHGQLSTFFLIENYKHRPETTTNWYSIPASFTLAKLTTTRNKIAQKPESTTKVYFRPPPFTELKSASTENYIKRTILPVTEVYSPITEDIAKENDKGYLNIDSSGNVQKSSTTQRTTISVSKPYTTTTTSTTTKLSSTTDSAMFSSTEELTTARTKPYLQTSTAEVFNDEENSRFSTPTDYLLQQSTTESAVQPLNDKQTHQTELPLTETPGVVEFTKLAESATEKMNNTEKQAVTELLNQFLLTTSVYELNPELLGDATTLENVQSTTEAIITVDKVPTTEKIDIPTLSANTNIASSSTLKPENESLTIPEANLVLSIEQLISQAIGNPDQSIENIKEGEKITQVIQNTNSKPMSEVQIETATAASALIGTPNTETVPNVTLEDDKMNQAVDSLISQVIYHQPIQTTEKFSTTDNIEKYTEQTTILNTNESDTLVDIHINNDINRYEELDLQDVDSSTVASFESKTVQPILLLNNENKSSYTTEIPEKTTSNENQIIDQSMADKVTSSTELNQEETKYQSTLYSEIYGTTEKLVQYNKESSKPPSQIPSKTESNLETNKDNVTDTNISTSTENLSISNEILKDATSELNQEVNNQTSLNITDEDFATSTENLKEYTSKSNEILNSEASELNQENYNENSSEPFLIVASSSEYPDYASTEIVDVFTKIPGYDSTTSGEINDSTEMVADSVTHLQFSTQDFSDAINNTEKSNIQNYETTENNLVTESQTQTTQEYLQTKYETTEFNRIREPLNQITEENFSYSTQPPTEKVNFPTTQQLNTISVTQQPLIVSTTLQPVTISTTYEPTITITQQPLTIFTTQQPIMVSTTQQPITVQTTQQHSTMVSSTEQLSTSSTVNTPTVAFPTTPAFVNLPTVTIAQKVEKPAELKLIQNSTSSTTTAKPDMTWTLVSTVVPHKTAYSSDETKTQAPHRQEATSVDLVPKPLQGFGLEDSTSTLDTDVFQFTELCNELAFSFWSSVTSGISFARSVIVSPFAATSMLAMVFLGARGSTSGEMNEILKLDDMVTFNPHTIFKNVIESIEVSKKSGVAVSVFVKELYSDKNKGKLLSFYKERVKQFYDGHVEEANFKEINDVIRRRTNLLVKRQTWGKIPEYLKDNNLFARPPLAAVSANIFQTDCSGASIEGRDGELHFVVLPSIRQRKLVPIPAVVWRSGFLAGYDPGLDATAVALGTKDQTISTIFVIPGQQGISAPGDGLMRLEARLVENAFRQGGWSRLLRSLIPRPGLEVQIPRFSHKSVINATMALQRMGLKDLFNSNTADLKGLNGVAHELYLSDIVQVNTFATCGEGRIDETHHSEVYPATTNRSFRRIRKIQHYHHSDKPLENSDILEEPRDYQRAFHDPLYDPTYLSLPLQLRPRQARLPEAPRLRFDRPFLYFVRHNPTGLILHMGRFNPRLLP